MLLLFEGAARIYSFVNGRPKSRTYLAPTSPPLSPHASYKVSLNIPSPGTIHSTRNNYRAPQSVHCTPSLVLWNSATGTALKPNLKSICRKFDVHGETIMETVYNTDNFGRRITPHPHMNPKSDQMIFLGCSFTFGEGVDEHETISGQVARNQSRYEVFNYSAPGWGPGNLLAKLESSEVVNELPATGEKIVIYTFIDHHLNRLIGSLDVFQAYPSWPTVLPAYGRRSDGSLVHQSMHLNYFNPVTWMKSLFGRSHFLAHFGIQLPLTLNHAHYQLWADVVKKMREQFQKHWGPVKFYVVFFPNSSFGSTLAPYLDQAQIHYLDYGPVRPSHHVNGPSYITDGHPSAGTYEFLAKQILRDIEVPSATGVL